MAVARTKTVAFQGIDTLEIDVQIQMTNGMPAFTVVGLPDKAVGESRERVRAALGSIRLALPPRRIVVNLSPADVLKEGSHYDLPIAVGLLISMGVLQQDELDEYAMLGELALDGTLSPVAGVLPAAIGANAAERGLIYQAITGGKAAWAGAIQILAPPDLVALINHFKGNQVLSPPKPGAIADTSPYLDLRNIKGQETAKRALEVAAATGHNVLMVGPPGAVKSMLSHRMAGLLPPKAVRRLRPGSQQHTRENAFGSPTRKSA